jgi:hypothetical protein
MCYWSNQSVLLTTANFTAQASCDTMFSKSFRSDALKFVVHFMGDLSQPLHVCGRERGGNSALIRFDGHRTNLHSIWDTYMVRKRIIQIGGYQSLYQAFLMNQIKKGEYMTLAKSWITKYPFNKLNHNGNSVDVIEWATDSGSLNCNVVWGPYDMNPDQDFGEDYFLKVGAIIDLQIAKAGVRLSDWLNNLFKKC